MNELIEKLKQARKELADTKAEQTRLYDEFKNSDAWLKLLTKQAFASQNVDFFEEEIRKQAIIQYAESQNKHPHPKIEIKIFKVFKTVDSAKVLAWVKSNLVDALVYDEKKVKNYATKIGPVEGTEIVEEPRVQIASEL